MTFAIPTRFVIFAAPRTGSNLLCSLLNSHPEIICHHGLFNPEGIHYALNHRHSEPYLGTAAERDRDPQTFLERVWHFHHGKRAVGFKLNLGEDPRAMSTVIRDPEIRKILLKRHNRIKTYVSERIAERSGEWESYNGPAAEIAQAMHVDRADLLRHVERNRCYYSNLEDELRGTGQIWLSVHYESLNPCTAENDLGRILAFLLPGFAGTQVPLLIPGSFKRNPDDLRTLINNFEELEMMLEGTGLESELHSIPTVAEATK